MSISLIVLGSGPSETIPRPGCSSPACRDARKPKSKSRRTRSSIVMQWRGKNILIDAGPDILEQIKQENIKKIDAILLTHGHSDAAGSLKVASIKYKVSSIPIFTEQPTWKYLQRLYGLKSFKVRFIKPNKSSKLFDLPVTPFRVHHAFREKIFPTLGFKIGPLIYASDVSAIPKNSEKYFKNAKILFLDAAMWFGKKIKWHLNTEQAINLAKKFRVKKLYLTQIGHSYPPHEQAQKKINKFCKKQKITFPVILAYDGLKVTINK